MGFFSSPTVAEKLKSTLAAFTYTSGVSERAFRDALIKHITRTLGVITAREGGVHLNGTKVDLHFGCGDEDVIVSIKHSINEQKVKILLGEALIVTQSVLTTAQASPTNLVVLLMFDERIREEAVGGAMNALIGGLALLDDYAKSLRKGKVRLHLAIAEPSKCEILHLA